MEPQAAAGCGAAAARPDGCEVVFFIKQLSPSDAACSKQIKLPKTEARRFLGELRHKQRAMVTFVDHQSVSWEFLCTCYGSQYALSRVAVFCNTYKLRAGQYLTFYQDCLQRLRVTITPEAPAELQAQLSSKAGGCHGRQQLGDLALAAGPRELLPWVDLCPAPPARPRGGAAAALPLTAQQLGGGAQAAASPPSAASDRSCATLAGAGGAAATTAMAATPGHRQVVLDLSCGLGGSTVAHQRWQLQQQLQQQHWHQQQQLLQQQQQQAHGSSHAALTSDPLLDGPCWQGAPLPPPEEQPRCVPRDQGAAAPAACARRADGSPASSPLVCHEQLLESPPAPRMAAVQQQQRSQRRDQLKLKWRAAESGAAVRDAPGHLQGGRHCDQNMPPPQALPHHPGAGGVSGVSGCGRGAAAAAAAAGPQAGRPYCPPASRFSSAYYSNAHGNAAAAAAAAAEAAAAAAAAAEAALCAHLAGGGAGGALLAAAGRGKRPLQPLEAGGGQGDAKRCRATGVPGALQCATQPAASVTGGRLHPGCIVWQSGRGGASKGMNDDVWHAQAAPAATDADGLGLGLGTKVPPLGSSAGTRRAPSHEAAWPPGGSLGLLRAWQALGEAPSAGARHGSLSTAPSEQLLPLFHAAPAAATVLPSGAAGCRGGGGCGSQAAHQRLEAAPPACAAVAELDEWSAASGLLMLSGC